MSNIPTSSAESIARDFSHANMPLPGINAAPLTAIPGHYPYQRYDQLGMNVPQNISNIDHYNWAHQPSFPDYRNIPQHVQGNMFSSHLMPLPTPPTYLPQEEGDGVELRNLYNSENASNYIPPIQGTNNYNDGAFYNYHDKTALNGGEVNHRPIVAPNTYVLPGTVGTEPLPFNHSPINPPHSGYYNRELDGYRIAPIVPTSDNDLSYNSQNGASYGTFANQNVSPTSSGGNTGLRKSSSTAPNSVKASKRQKSEINSEEEDNNSGDGKDSDRRTANNARERIRVSDINGAYKQLEKVCVSQSDSSAQKTQTKLGILYLARDRIQELEDKIRARNLDPMAAVMVLQQTDRMMF
uniref:BHLH domain-containing protein n=1 Tax=Rhabditophanes sp. KR3021 TaxID=114890 RepID=A0AC35TFJ1_9BILA